MRPEPNARHQTYGLFLARAAGRWVAESGGEDGRAGQQFEAVIEFVVGDESRGQAVADGMLLVLPGHREDAALAVADLGHVPARTDQFRVGFPALVAAGLPFVSRKYHAVERAVGHPMERDQPLAPADELLHGAFGRRPPAGTVVVHDHEIAAAQSGGGDAGHLLLDAHLEAARAFQQVAQERGGCAPVVILAVDLPGQDQRLQARSRGSIPLRQQAYRQKQCGMSHGSLLSPATARAKARASAPAKAARNHARLRSIIGPPWPSHSMLRTPS